MAVHMNEEGLKAEYHEKQAAMWAGSILGDQVGSAQDAAQTAIAHALIAISHRLSMIQDVLFFIGDRP